MGANFSVYVSERKLETLPMYDPLLPTKPKTSLPDFSTLAGPLKRVKKNTPYRVRFVRLSKADPLIHRVWSYVLAYGSTIMALAFAAMIFKPSNWVALLNPTSAYVAESWIMLGCLVMLQLFVIVGTFAATRSTIKAMDPVPVYPQKDLAVALVTTRAPGEPVELVETTLKAAKNVRYNQGLVDIWLLDETGDHMLKDLCNRLGVRYFSRAGIEKWNTTTAKQSLMTRIASKLSFKRVVVAKILTPSTHMAGRLAARTKHGNFNAWMDHLEHQDIAYDILAGIDTDHVPRPNFLTRLLGYFNDPDVAYAVGPQVYGNYTSGSVGLITRWAESQASFFQSTIQRAGNASTSAMFVGTNYAVRMSALRQIGGFQPFITEDMATGLAIHANKNPDTGNHWKSVYTPDVLAIGEGPGSWSAYFSQQWRWAAGTFDTWRRLTWRVIFKLPYRARVHYLLMLSFYPMAALTWLIACVSCGIYLVTGATAVIAPWGQFLSLYLMTTVMQLSLYFWNRRFNVSPHEPAGSYGIAGMVLTTLAAPVYVAALMGVMTGRNVNFVVTKKGKGLNPDSFLTFRLQLWWLVGLMVALAFGFGRGNDNLAILIWIFLLVATCLMPVILGMTVARPKRNVPVVIRNIIQRRRTSHA